jgi:hypothetical protein
MGRHTVAKGGRHVAAARGPWRTAAALPAPWPGLQFAWLLPWLALRKPQCLNLAPSTHPRLGSCTCAMCATPATCGTGLRDTLRTRR